jgi:hypothetical protein
MWPILAADFTSRSNLSHASGANSSSGFLREGIAMSDIFRNAYLKVKRANSHIDALVRDSAPLSKDLYELSNEPARSVAALAQPDCFDLSYRPKEPITEHFGAIIGDAVNNLREAMDYWANTAVAAVGPRRKVHFPFAEKRENLETSPGYPAIQHAFPDLAAFIGKDIQPCRDTNLYLWAATSLCNDNKHNDFVPLVSVMELQGANLMIAGNLFESLSISGDANRPFTPIRSGTPIPIEKNLGISVEITFPKGAVFENQPVVPTLLNMSKVVSQSLDALTQFARPYIK